MVREWKPTFNCHVTTDDVNGRFLAVYIGFDRKSFAWTKIDMKTAQINTLKWLWEKRSTVTVDRCPVDLDRL